jgi:hypothetical protein
MTRLLRKARTKYLMLALLSACSSDPDGPDPGAIPSVPSVPDPGTEVAVSPPEAVGELSQQLTQARQVTPDELRASHAVEFAGELGYDPLTAPGLDAMLTALGVQAVDETKARLSRTGFAVGGRGTSSFASGYAEIYSADLPVFISADMVLEAVYRSHDKILQSLEQQTLQPRLQKLLKSMRQSLIDSAEQLQPEVASDLNFFLGVALSLLDKGRVDSREPPGVQSFVEAAMKAAGEQERVLFGVKRLIDFSQFEPRGHYAGDATLEGYFRAMMWLGRIDFRLIETQVDGSQVLRRRQVESMVALRRLLDSSAYREYLAIDATISGFVGEHDYMTLQQVDELLTTLDAPGGLSDVDDSTLANALVAGSFGEQRIASQVMRRHGAGAGPLPLSMSFALFGQRYTVDSHVFSNLVYDRLPTRVVPDPLDVAFAALANDQALALLADELDKEPGYNGELAAVRLLVDGHPLPYWQGSLYTTWLKGLRALSPTAKPAAELPAVARTEAWGKRLLNTQLSSWAQLRHNNVLYAKQSYTSGAACEYPAAYVDPYPEFFRAMVGFAERGQELATTLDLGADFAQRVQAYFESVARINLTLAEMAVAQRSGAPHSAEHMAFINQAVTTSVNCDGTVLGHTGWYSELHFDPLQAVEMDPAITDVHTDVGGDLPVAREASVLHVGTGLPRLMVVTVDSCEGPRAYAGVVSSFHQVLEGGLTRLTDAEWKKRIQQGNEPPVPAWLGPVFGGD